MPAIECPTCKRQIQYQVLTEVPFRPFCSERCKLIDLSKWFNEEFKVSEEPSEADIDELLGPDEAD